MLQYSIKTTCIAVAVPAPCRDSSSAQLTMCTSQQQAESEHHSLHHLDVLLFG
jgi:hypothetical protein